MAGNPFRRKQDQDQLPQLRSEDATKAFDDAIQAVTPSDSTRRRPAVKKHVRIKTPPPLSPESPDTLIRKVSNEGHTGSPPPQSPVEGVGNPEDPFETQFATEIIASQSKEAIDNTRRNSATNTEGPPPAEAVVLNPFQSTLATIEPSKAKVELQKKKEANASDTQKSGPASALDVDSFTTMLMTGAAPPVALNRGQPVNVKPQSKPAEDSSARDGKDSTASSTTNPSASDPSPASYADLSSASSDDDDELESNIRTPSSALPSAKVPPPVPRHKHGRSIQEPGPQTVSFADFDDVSKSSPPNPTVGSVPGQIGLPSSRKASGSSDTTSSLEKTASQTWEGAKRARPPPPIPTSRRSNSVKSQTHQDAETSSISSNQPQSPDLEPPLSPGHTKSHRAPPPPPSRRMTGRSGQNADQANSSDITSLNSDNTSLAGDSILSTDSSSLRQAATAPVTSSRHSSGSIPTTSAMPPPPPPRRRRGSSKSSMEAPFSGENRRTSHEGSRTTSGLTQVSETGDDGKPSRDTFLDDLSALQAEVDALHEQSIRRAS